MEQAVAVDVPDRAGDRLHQPGRDARRKGFRQSLLEGAAGDVFEHQEEPPVRLAVIIERHDVGVPDARYRTRLAQPAAARASARVRPMAPGRIFRATRRSRPVSVRQVDHAHRTPAQFGLDLETRDARPSLRPGKTTVGSGRRWASRSRTSLHSGQPSTCCSMAAYVASPNARCRGTQGPFPRAGRHGYQPSSIEWPSRTGRPSGPRRTFPRRGASGPPAPWRRTPRYGSSPGPWRSSRRSSRRRRPARTHPTYAA